MTAVLVFDIGTSKIKAGLYSENGEKLGESTRGTELIFPKNGWAEQDPNHWISVMNDMANKLLKIDNVEAIGITGQMIGLVPVNRNLDPIENAIIWLDSRANNEAEQILEKISLMDFLE
ncbi:MAG: FGGY family carbohydrate kinase, partial [Thermoplasmata archaeon]